MFGVCNSLLRGKRFIEEGNWSPNGRRFFGHGNALPVLCTEKNETVARYSVLNDRKQIFASKYMLFLPTEEQLRREIEKERRLLENTLKDRDDE